MSTDKKKGEKLIGSTNKKKRKRLETIEKTKDDIVENFVKNTEQDYLTQVSKKGLFEYLVKEQIT